MGNSKFLYFICALCLIVAGIAISPLVQQKFIIQNTTTPKQEHRIEYASPQEILEMSRIITSMPILPTPKISLHQDYDSFQTSLDINDDRNKISSKLNNLSINLIGNKITKKQLEEMKAEIKEIEQDIRYYKLRVDQYNSTH
jgi:hypothetical protein